MTEVIQHGPWCQCTECVIRRQREDIDRQQAIKAEADRRKTLTPLQIVQERIKKMPDRYDLPLDTLLLLDIAVSMREANKMAREGLDFSNALSKQMLDNQ